MVYSFFFQAEDGIRAGRVTGVQTCALPISPLARELGGRAPEAHLVQDGPGVLEADRRRIAASAGATQLDDQARDEPVERALTEAVVDHWPVDQVLAELLVELVDRIRGVGAVGGDGALDAGAVAGPDLRLPVAGPDEEDVPLLGVRRVDNGDGVRLVEAGQEEEVGALAELVMDVAVTPGLVRPGDDREGVADRRREAQPPVCEGSELTGRRHGS